MSESSYRARWIPWRGRLTGLCLLLVALLVYPATHPAAQAAPTVTVKVTIESVDGIVRTEGPDADDYFAEVGIDGQFSDNEDNRIDDDFNITPDWEFSRTDVQATGSIPIVIRIWDYDDFLRLGNDVIDIYSGPGTQVDINLTFSPCAFTGGPVASCGETVVTQGNNPPSGDADGTAKVAFRVEVLDPTTAPGLNVSCSHSPLWPEDGDTVTIVARSSTAPASIPEPPTRWRSG